MFCLVCFSCLLSVRRWKRLRCVDTEVLTRIAGDPGPSYITPDFIFKISILNLKILKLQQLQGPGCAQQHITAKINESVKEYDDVFYKKTKVENSKYSLLACVVLRSQCQVLKKSHLWLQNVQTDWSFPGIWIFNKQKSSSPKTFLPALKQKVYWRLKPPCYTIKIYRWKAENKNIYQLFQFSFIILNPVRPRKDDKKAWRRKREEKKN